MNICRTFLTLLICTMCNHFCLSQETFFSAGSKKDRIKVVNAWAAESHQYAQSTDFKNSSEYMIMQKKNISWQYIAFSDGLFKKYFGKPYAELSTNELVEITDLLYMRGRGVSTIRVDYILREPFMTKKGFKKINPPYVEFVPDERARTAIKEINREEAIHPLKETPILAEQKTTTTEAALENKADGQTVSLLYLPTEVEEYFKLPVSFSSISLIRYCMRSRLNEIPMSSALRELARTKLKNQVDSMLSILVKGEAEKFMDLPKKRESIITMNEWYKGYKENFLGLLVYYVRSEKGDEVKLAEECPLILRALWDSYWKKRSEILQVLKTGIDNEIAKASIYDLCTIERIYPGTDAPAEAIFNDIRLNVKERRFQMTLQEQEKIRKPMGSSISTALNFKGMVDSAIYADAIYSKDFLKLGAITTHVERYSIYIALIAICAENFLNKGDSVAQLDYYQSQRDANVGYSWGRKTITTWMSYDQTISVRMNSRYLKSYLEACKLKNRYYDISNGFEFEMVEGKKLRMQNFVFLKLDDYLRDAKKLSEQNRPDHPGIKLLIENLHQFISGNWGTKVRGEYQYYTDYKKGMSEDRYYYQVPVHFYPALPELINGEEQAFYFTRYGHDSSSISSVTICPMRTCFDNIIPISFVLKSPREIEKEINNFKYRNNYFFIITNYQLRIKGEEAVEFKTKINWYSKGELPSREIQEYLKGYVGEPIGSYPEEVKAEILASPVP